MKNILKKHCIKIPNNITIIYSNKKKIITIIGPYKKKTFKLAVNIFILPSENTIQVSSVPISKISNNKKKTLKSIQGTTVALIKQLILETSSIFFKKLKFIGIGYRSFQVKTFENELLLFKLGYSHDLYFRIPNKIKIFCLKLTKLFIYGNSYQNVTQIASKIQSYKKPEPYKGKGILYEDEQIILKEGKKI